MIRLYTRPKKGGKNEILNNHDVAIDFKKQDEVAAAIA